MSATDLRRDIAQLTTLAHRDLMALWRQVRSAAEAREALNDILPALIDTYGAAAATVAATWYDDLRDKVAPPKRFTAIPAPVGDRGAPALIGWALDSAQDFGTFQTLIEGGTQRRIADVSRDTVAASSVADPATDGWQRVGAGACAFCAMLIGRGAVYSEAGADFASHDHCNCQAAPAFKGEPRPVKAYTPTSRNITDADRARVRAYLASN